MNLLPIDSCCCMLLKVSCLCLAFTGSPQSRCSFWKHLLARAKLCIWAFGAMISTTVSETTPSFRTSFFWRLPWNNDRWSCSLNIRFFWHVALSEDDSSLGLKRCFYTGPMWENPPWKLGVFWTAKEWIYKSFYESVYEYLFKSNKWNTVECKLDPA